MKRLSQEMDSIDKDSLQIHGIRKESERREIELSATTPRWKDPMKQITNSEHIAIANWKMSPRKKQTLNIMSLRQLENVAKEEALSYS